MTRILPTAALALILSACAARPTINTIALPETALQPRPLPVLESVSNRSVGIYAIECRSLLIQSNEDKAAIRKSAGVP